MLKMISRESGSMQRLCPHAARGFAKTKVNSAQGQTPSGRRATEDRLRESEQHGRLAAMRSNRTLGILRAELGKLDGIRSDGAGVNKKHFLGGADLFREFGHELMRCDHDNPRKLAGFDGASELRSKAVVGPKFIPVGDDEETRLFGRCAAWILGILAAIVHKGKRRVSALPAEGGGVLPGMTDWDSAAWRCFLNRG